MICRLVCLLLAAALAELLISTMDPGRVLYPGAARVRPEFEEAMTTAGWTVEHVEAYRTRLVHPGRAAVRDALDCDAITFTSGSTVEGWLRVADAASTPPVVSIGPTTTRVARDLGLAVADEAHAQNLDALVDAVERVVEAASDGS